MTSNNRRRRGRGEGGISGPRKDGLYVVSFSLGVVEGRRKRKTFYAKSKAEAIEILKREQSRLGLVENTSEILLGTYLSNWFEARKDSLAANTQTLHAHYLRHHIVPYIGGVKLAKITPQTLRTWFSETKAKGVGQATRAKAYSLLSSGLKQAVRDGVLLSTPTARLDPMEIPREPETAVKFWETETLARLVQEGEPLAVSLGRAASSRSEILAYPAIVLGAFTGMRLGELLGVRWTDVDLKGGAHGIISLEDQMLYVQNKPQGRGDLKTTNSIRSIALSPIVRGVLLRHKERLLALGLGGKELVFVNKKGEVWHQGAFRNVYYRFIERLGLERINPHAMRHTHATHLLNNRENPKLVAQRLGDTVETVMATYAHVVKGADVEAAARFDEGVLGSTGGVKDGRDDEIVSGSSTRKT